MPLSRIGLQPRGPSAARAGSVRFTDISCPRCGRNHLHNTRRYLKDAMISSKIIFSSLLLLSCALSNCLAQTVDTLSRRSSLRGGTYDKPFLTQLGRTEIGGYADAQWRYIRVDGVKEELTFSVPRFNLFTFTPVSERVRVAAELEVEDGGEEIELELAVLDVEVNTALTLRGGILLVPMGHFNLNHDSPSHDFVDRPLVSTMIIPSTWSDAGMGMYGTFFPTDQSRISYELYAINGLDDDIVSATGEGTRIRAGRHNLEDNNAHPSIVSRVGISPVLPLEVGISGYSGPYNQFTQDGLTVDEKRNLSLFALDAELLWKRYSLRGEHARAQIDLPTGLSPLFASKQNGSYVEAGVNFLNGALSAMPESFFLSSIRYDLIDLDADHSGDDRRKLSLAVGFRPTPQTIFKLNWTREWETDRFDVETPQAGILFGLASYF